MARTSNRRWKGCAMCKPRKFAGYGDSFRQPPQVQREMGSPKRWNRHNIPDDQLTPHRSNKDTRRWCKGKPGRLHQPAIERDPWGWSAHRDCGPPWTADWFCRHREVCSVCGKVLRQDLESECPDRPSRTTGVTTR